MTRPALDSSAIRHVTMALLVAVHGMVLLGCDEESEAASEARGLEPTDRPSSTALPESPYGPDGQLRESDQVVAGLTLPMGLELDYERDRQHVYQTGVPIEKVAAYFGPRLLTGEVERVGDGAVYRRAVPKGASGGVVKLDVSILPASTGTRVQIREIRPAPRIPPDPEELKRRLEAERGPFE